MQFVDFMFSANNFCIHNKIIFRHKGTKIFDLANYKFILCQIYDFIWCFGRKYKKPVIFFYHKERSRFLPVRAFISIEKLCPFSFEYGICRRFCAINVSAIASAIFAPVAGLL
jgi:hypothetical protein